MLNGSLAIVSIIIFCVVYMVTAITVVVLSQVQRLNGDKVKFPIVCSAGSQGVPRIIYIIGNTLSSIFLGIGIVGHVITIMNAMNNLGITIYSIIMAATGLMMCPFLILMSVFDIQKFNTIHTIFSSIYIASGNSYAGTSIGLSFYAGSPIGIIIYRIISASLLMGFCMIAYHDVCFQCKKKER